MTFGERLKSLRLEAGMTQDELAKELGVSARVLGYYESDDRFPKDQKTLLAIAGTFQISLDYLLDNPIRPGQEVTGDAPVATACPSKYCYVKILSPEDRRRVNDFVRYIQWQKREEESAEEELEEEDE